MMHKKFLLIMTIGFFCFSGHSAYADPVVSSVSGMLTHRGSVSINGINFGTKNPAYPLHWSDMESAMVDNPSVVQSEGLFSEVWSPASCDSWRPMYKGPSSYRWIAGPHARSTRILGGGHKDSFADGNQNCRNMMVTVAASAPQKIWYAHWYQRFSPDFPQSPRARGVLTGQFDAEYIISLNGTINTTQTSIVVQGADYNRIGVGDVMRIDSEKLKVTSRVGTTVSVTRGYMATTPASHSHGAQVFLRGTLYNLKVGTLNPGLQSFGSPPGHFQFYGLDYNEPSVNYYDFEPLGEGGGINACGGCSRGGGLSVIYDSTNAASEWKHVEILVQDSAPGWARSFVDNVKSKDCMCTNRLDEISNATDFRSISLGSYFRYFYPEDTTSGIYHGSNYAWTYLDDIYVDNTFSRVVLANNANYDAATIVEPQIPSAWSNSSVTVQVNLGRLASSGNAYLFVFDASNVRNTVGYPVTINDSTPPTNQDLMPPAAPALRP